VSWRSLLAVTALGLTACAAAEEDAGPRADVRVIVPGGLVGPFSELVPKFEAAYPELRVDWDRANMVTITDRVVSRKADPDVFLSLGDAEIEIVRRAGLTVPRTRKKIVANSLVLLVPKGDPAGVSELQDLTSPRVTRLAVPDPEFNSAGARALAAFRHAGIWEAISPKIIYVRYVADAQTLAEKGEVQAAIVYYPCVFEVYEPGTPPQAPRRVDIAQRIGEDLAGRFFCEGVVLTGAANPADGEALLEFLGSAEAAPTWRKWHFLSPDEQAGTLSTIRPSPRPLAATS
jgi:molybdate transport system substrate-binding protein